MDSIIRVQDPADVMRRIWASPTFEIHGLSGILDGGETVVPGHANSRSVCGSFRSGTGKSVALLKKHVAKVNPDVKVEKRACSIHSRVV